MVIFLFPLKPFLNTLQRLITGFNLSQNWLSMQQVVAEDNRYADFKAVKNRQVFNNNARVNEAGGNDYWEGGISNPDLVLSDLIKIFHPELLPDHKFVYYRQLN